MDRSQRTHVSRRGILKFVGAAGLGGSVFGRALAALATGSTKVSPDMLSQAAWISGIELSDEELQLMLEDVDDLLADFGLCAQRSSRIRCLRRSFFARHQIEAIPAHASQSH